MHTQVACAALADGAGKGDLFRGAAELDARAAVESLRRSWPLVKGIAGGPDDPGESARRSQGKTTLQVAGLQHPVTHADTDARCIRDARGGRSRAGIPAPGSGPRRHGTLEELRRGSGVGLADGSAGPHRAHGSRVPHERTAPPRRTSVPRPGARYGVCVRPRYGKRGLPTPWSAVLYGTRSLLVTT